MNVEVELSKNVNHGMLKIIPERFQIHHFCDKNYNYNRQEL